MIRALVRSILIAAAFIAAYEFLARSRGWFDPTVRDDPYLGFPGTNELFRLVPSNDGSMMREVSPNKRNKYRNRSFAAEKASDEVRVFCVGGSGVRSDAFMDPDGSFPFMLSRYLRAAYPDRKITVINAGGGGMGSIQNLEVIREVLDYAPDLIVEMPEGGEKNMIPPAPQGILAIQDDESPLRVFARRHLTKLRAYHTLREFYQRCMPRAGDEQFQLSAFSAFIAAIVTSEFDPQIFSRFMEFKVDRVPPIMEPTIPKEEIVRAHERFQRNLSTMAELCRKRGVPILFVMPLRNLRGSFYHRFHVNPDEILPGREAEWKERYARGVEAKRAGRFEEAVAALRSVRELYVRDEDDILAYYLGECLEALGRKSEALAEYSLPYLRHPTRALLTETATKEAVPIVDVFADVVASSASGVPGYDEFTDTVHPMPQTNRWIARGVYKAILEHRWLPNLPPLESESLALADKVVVLQCDKCEPPLSNRMLRAILSKREMVAIELARKVRESDLIKLSIEPIYYGWALTRLGRTEEARAWFLKLKQSYLENRFVRRVPKLETDADIVRVAYGGDIFHWF